jgi:hypothetical protein
VIETGLLIAQAVFLILLYLFVWSVVRSSSRQIDAPLPPAPAPRPAKARAPRPSRKERKRAEAAEKAMAAAAAAEAARAAAAAAAPPPPPPPPPPPAPVAAEPERSTAESRSEEPLTEPAGRERDRGRGEAPLDLGANIHPKLIVERSPALAQGREIELDGGLTIGRSGSSGLPIGDPFVSHMHARIMKRGQFLFVEDLGSTNGTFLNDRRVEGDAQLKVRDQLRIGETVLRYEE